MAWRALVLAFALLAFAAPSFAERAPDLVLRTELSGKDHQSYRELPFKVPPGVRRITVETRHDGREQRTVVDLGLRDPERFRGWSGGDKQRFTLSAEDATPSYLPGPLPSGTWALTLGFPNIRKDSRAQFEARIWFERGPGFDGFAEAPLRTEAGWYRGDLHLHTGHSDGTCVAHGGAGRAPCPVFRTVEAALARKLDFIAVTDHNTTSTGQALRELQPAYASLLLIQGREITTFRGHANVIGPLGFVDFRQGLRRPPGALLTVNHPAAPSGEACMGCGWTVANTDWRQVDAVEVVNGGLVRAMNGAAEGPLSGVRFWEARLNEGHRLIAVGASDNHDPDLAPRTPSSVGRPQTVVFARELSQAAILEGLRSGRAFVDVEGAGQGMIELMASAGGHTAVMGEALVAQIGESVRFSVSVRDIAGAIEVIEDGRRLDVADAREFQLKSDGARHWVRINLRALDGRLLMIGNPIWLYPAPQTPAKVEP